MWFLALATDYDGTIARDGRVDDDTVAALRRVKESGRRLVLVTGRPMDEFFDVVPEADLFDRIVAENGALLFRPATREEVLLTKPADPHLVDALREKAVEPLAVGRGIVSTWEPNQDVVLEAIHRLGLELEIIFNKGAVMVLPSGVNKASGLDAALLELGLSHHNAAGVGDAENDHAFLQRCEVSAAVGNALPALKARVDYVAEADHGAGVAEFIDHLMRHDPASPGTLLGRHQPRPPS